VKRRPPASGAAFWGIAAVPRAPTIMDPLAWHCPRPPGTHQRRAEAHNRSSTAAGSSNIAITRMNQRMVYSSVEPSSVARYRTGPRSASTLARPVDRGLLNLEGGKCLGLVGALGNQICTGLALVVGQPHGRGGAAAGGGLLTAVSIWAIRRSRSATTPAWTPRRASTSAPRLLIWTSPAAWCSICALARNP
jgi:hypothetical protein